MDTNEWGLTVLLIMCVVGAIVMAGYFYIGL